LFHIEKWKHNLEGEWKHVDKHLKDRHGGVVMDGCSLGLELSKCTGTVIIAASQSQYTKNLEQEIFNTETLMIPPLDGTEAVAMERKLGVEEAVIQEKFLHTRGITRYLFQSGVGTKRVDKAIEVVNASAICRMVSSQSASKGDNQVIVYSLALWSVPKYVDGNFKCGASQVFLLVSRNVERMVSEKLVKETLTVLKEAQSNCPPPCRKQKATRARCSKLMLFECSRMGAISLCGVLMVVTQLKPRNLLCLRLQWNQSFSYFGGKHDVQFL
jgi:hypothetical protein